MWALSIFFYSFDKWKCTRFRFTMCSFSNIYFSSFYGKFSLLHLIINVITFMRFIQFYYKLQKPQDNNSVVSFASQIIVNANKTNTKKLLTQTNRYLYDGMNIFLISLIRSVRSMRWIRESCDLLNKIMFFLWLL